MSGTFDDTSRQVIPRWLDYKTSCIFGLLGKTENFEQRADVLVRNPKTTIDYQTNPTLFTAVDLVIESLIFKNFESSDSHDAAVFILDNAPNSSRLIREIAEHFLNEPNPKNDLTKNIFSEDYIRSSIAILKSSVRAHPLNPVAWSDLSLFYATLGYMEKAQKSMNVALALGKQNRFILRSATRCFFHAGDPNRAISLLRNSQICDSDPWITAAEIALSDDMEIQSRCIKFGRSLVADDNISPFSRSELAAAISTMEAKSGAHKKVKRLVKQALKDPSENALAQIEWLASQKYTRPPPVVKTKASWEAESRHFYREKKFEESLIATEEWAQFQPFSSQPLIQATFISSVCLNKDKHTIRIAYAAPQTHRKNPLVIDNLAFALARQNDLNDAIEELNKIDSHNLKGREIPTISATHGLIKFRSGDFEKGRELYKKAILEFDRNQDFRSAAIASFFWATEEKKANSIEAETRIADAKKRVKKSKVFELEDAAKSL